jgi:hypothetical protein
METDHWALVQPLVVCRAEIGHYWLRRFPLRYQVINRQDWLEATGREPEISPALLSSQTYQWCQIHLEWAVIQCSGLVPPDWINTRIQSGHIQRVDRAIIAKDKVSALAVHMTTVHRQRPAVTKFLPRRLPARFSASGE